MPGSVVNSLTRMDRVWRYGRKKTLTNTGFDCSALSPSHTSGHKPVNVPRAKISDELSCLDAQLTTIQHPPTRWEKHTHAHMHNPHPPFDFRPLLGAALGFSTGSLWDFWQCLLLCAMRAQSSQAQAHTHFYGSVMFFCTVSTKWDKHVATYLWFYVRVWSRSYIQDVKQKADRFWGPRFQKETYVFFFIDHKIVNHNFQQLVSHPVSYSITKSLSAW